MFVAQTTQQISLTVDNNGWVTSTTDFNNHITDYAYDSMGRLTTVNPADSQWADTSIRYATATDSIGAGLFKQTITKGGLTSARYHDALLRPVLTKTSDGSTNIYTTTRFNAYNKATFNSYPSNSATNTSGTTTTFDGMQREKQINQTGVIGTISYAYLAGNKRKVTNNRGHATTTTYLALGQPSYNNPTAISAPESVYTAFKHNWLGNITQISQGGLTEYRYYDSQHRLCQTYRKDTGKTVYDYNTIGELTWYAEGASGGTSSCARTDVPASERVNLTYTNIGHIKTKNFADPATADVTYAYDPNGNVTSINNGLTHWAYAYNSQNQATTEILTLDSQTFGLAYGYDSLGNLSTQTYPSGRQVSYAPNAFGQQTKAGSFATNANYHANGTLTDFNYGNGLTYSLTLNNRQLPETLKTLNGSTALTHLHYAYDANGNTRNITDYMNQSYNISMGYDGMDRLTQAKGKWGVGSFSYDTMGNIKGKSLSSMAVSYNYDATTKRLNSASVSGTKSKNYVFTYNSKGAVTNNGHTALPRNQANEVTSASGHSFTYDGNSKRVKDTKDYKHRYSVYNKSGQMIYQWDQRTDTITDYIFLGKTLVTEAQVSLGNGNQSVDNTNVGYTGHQWDNDSGLNYMQARYYDPLLGRFYSNDPVGFTGELDTFNRYLYVANNPYKYTDPGGRNKRYKSPKNVHRDNVLSQKLGEFIVKKLPDGAVKDFVQKGVDGLRTLNKYNDSSYSKHGNTAKASTKGVNSPKPTDGQAALDNSVPVSANSTARVGVDVTNKQVVVLKSNGKNTNEFHGFVPKKLNQAEANAVRKNFPNVKVKNNGSCTVSCN